MSRDDQSQEILSDLVKVAQEIQEPQKGNLEVGKVGIDRNGTYLVLAINGKNMTYRRLDGDRTGQEFTHPLASKQQFHNTILREKEIVAQPAKIPGFLSVDEITWTPEMAYFIGWLAGAGNVHFYLETREGNVDAVVNKYHGETGVILTPDTPGVFNVIPDEHKYGSKCEIKFRPTNTIPDALAREQRVPGIISRYPLFWALVEQGFTVEGPQDATKIRLSVPDSVKAYFDQGTAGQNYSQAVAAPAQ